ncbi:MAG: hypothetical protein KF708_18325 [Pirellulales bacterium]|nr:hypothetical protein [Pirellulales bacterium]
MSVGFAPLTARAADDTLSLGTRRELFVDASRIERLDRVALKLHEPCHAGAALAFDHPWEGPFCGYVTLFRDGDKFRMYYRGMHEADADGSPGETTCYAESTDGIHWEKPNLGLFEVQGTRENNVVLADAAPATHNFAPFLDTRPDVPADERYKALGGTAQSGLIAYVSADGLRWRPLQADPVFQDSGWVFDSQNNACWSEAEQCYVLYYRKSPEKVRSIARATSPDFRSWTAGEMMDFGPAPVEHLYTNQTQPYHRAPQYYIGVAARFLPGRQVITAEEAQQIGVNPKYFGDVSDAVLLTSRGGLRYDRAFAEAFVRPGPGLENWVSRTNYPARGILDTGPHEMSLYVQKNYGQPTARLDRYTLRPDGFISAHAPYAGGELVTKPFTFGGTDEIQALRLNFATSAAGGIKVELQDAAGKPIPGFTLDESIELVGDDLDRAVSWKSSPQLHKLAGQPVRLRFVMHDADLYAFQFR